MTAIIHVLFPVVVIAVVGFALEMVPEVSDYLCTRAEAELAALKARR